MGAAGNVIILEMARQCDAVAEASPNALKCDFHGEDYKCAIKKGTEKKGDGGIKN